MTKKLFIPNLRTRQELIGNNLMEVCCDYPDQIRPIIDELVSHLDNNQLDQMEDFIVKNPPHNCLQLDPQFDRVDNHLSVIIIHQ